MAGHGAGAAIGGVMPALPPLLVALAAIALLVALVTWLRVNAFIALLAAAVFAGVGGGLAPLGTVHHLQGQRPRSAPPAWL